MLATLQKQFIREQQSNQSLRQEIERQRRLIEKVATIEQWQADQAGEG